MNTMDPKWFRVDWTKPDGAIAKRLGVSRQRVWQVRTKLGEPSPHATEQQQLHRKLRQLPIEQMTRREVADALDMSVDWVSTLLKRMGREPKRPRRERPADKRVLRYLSQHPGATTSDIRDFLGYRWPHAGANRMQEMLSKGLVVRRGEGTRASPYRWWPA